MVTGEEVQVLANVIFCPERLTIAMVGPVEDEKAVYDTISL
jgi:predicted Zn-dependent peptidase